MGLFGKDDRIESYTQGRSGLFHGGGAYLLGIQALTCVCVTAWSMLATFVLLLVSELYYIFSLNINKDK